jgi:hypothetical protein
MATTDPSALIERWAHASLCSGVFHHRLGGSFLRIRRRRGGAAGIAKILFIVFLIGAIVSFLMSLGRRV